jgi:flagellar FliJ protein
MNKFVFKLEPLYEYRQRLEDICQKEFGEAMRRLDDEEGKLTTLNDGYRRSSEEIDKLKEEGGQAEELNMYYAYFMGLDKHISEQKRIIAEVRAVFEGKRGELVEATRDRKVVETLKERSMDSYNHKLDKEEQKATDDIVSSMFNRSDNDEI